MRKSLGTALLARGCTKIIFSISLEISFVASIIVAGILSGSGALEMLSLSINFEIPSTEIIMGGSWEKLESGRTGILLVRSCLKTEEINVFMTPGR